MKRKLSLLLAVVMILGSFSFTFAAETTAEEAAGNFLMEQGVIEGINGELKLDDNFRRQDMVVMLSRLMGEEDTAMAFPTDSLTFTDFSDPYYRPIIAWAVAEGLIEGHTPERFGFGENVTAQQYATVLLRALGYGEEVSGDGYANALDLAKELGLLGDYEFENDTVVTRGQMYVSTVNALGTAMKDSDETLADKLGVEMPEPEVLEVVDVYADNLKEVVVEFNKPVDASTVTDKTVYVKNVKGTATASEDGMSVVITVNDKLTNQKSYTLVVEGVKDADGVEIAKTEKEFKAFDATLPEAVEIVVTGPRNFDIIFSEPIDEAGTVKVTKGNTVLGNKVEDNDTRRVSVTVYRNLEDGAEYSVTVEEFKDFEGYKNVVNTLTFVYEKDENPPVATVAKAEQTYVVVDFDKPVSGLKKDYFYHTFSAWTAEEIFEDADMKNKVESSEKVTRVYVQFYKDKDNGRALPEGTVRFGILGSKIVDNWGNALGNVEFTLNVSADSTPLEVVSLEVAAENQLLVEFNKAIASFNKSNVEILDENGKAISGLKWNADDSDGDGVYEITLSKKMSGKTITVVIKNVKDKAIEPNVLSSYTEVIEITDKTPPKVSKVYYNAEIDDDDEFESAELMVIFNEEVDGETARVASNYSLVDGDEVTILTKAPEFDVNSARVIIPLTKDQYDVASKAGVKLQVINVKDLAGNTIVPQLWAITGNVKEKAKTVEVTSVVAKSTNTISITFADLVYEVSEGDFKFYIDGEEKEVEYGYTQTDNSVTTLDFELEKDFNTDAKNVKVVYKANSINNSFGNPVEALVFNEEEVTKITSITDKVAPAIAVDEHDDYEITWDADKNAVVIEFTEAIDNTTLRRLTYSVENYDVKKVYSDDNKVYIVINGEVKVGTELVITQEEAIFDLAGNAFELDDVITFVVPEAE